MPLTAPTGTIPTIAYTEIYNIANPQNPLIPSGSTVRLQYQPAKSYPLMVDVQESLYFGRTAPVAEYGQAFYEVAQFSFFVPFYDSITGQYAYQVDPADTTYADTPVLQKIVNIIRNQQTLGQGTVVKEPNGKILIGHIGNFVPSREPPNHWRCTFSFSGLDSSIYV